MKFPYYSVVISLISSLADSADLANQARRPMEHRGFDWISSEHVEFQPDPWDKLQIAYPNGL